MESEGDEDMLSLLILDPETMGGRLCVGVIGSRGTVCIKPASLCTIKLHEKKVNISNPMFFISCGLLEESDKVHDEPTLLVAKVNRTDVDMFLLQTNTYKDWC